MSDEKISAMPNAAALTGAELVPVVQGGGNVKATTQNIANLTPTPAGANPTATVGTAAVNGVAATFLRSDGAPPLAAGSVFAGPRSLEYIFGQQTTYASHTGDTNETKLFSVKIPANTLGLNGGWRLTNSYRSSGAGGSKTFRIYFSPTNDLTGTLLFATVQSAGSQSSNNIYGASNRNATNSQFGYNLTALNSNNTSAIDTTADAFVVVSVQLANGGDTGGIDYSVLEFLPIGGN